jgi:anti-anti-sigma factor
MSCIGADSKANLVIANSIAEMEKVVDFVERFGAAHAIPRAITNALNLCLDELLNNTISYGYEDQELHSIAIELSLANGVLVAEIQDDATPFDPRKVVFAAPNEPLRSRRIGGLGVHFVKTLVDELGYMRVGRQNLVRITKRLSEEQAMEIAEQHAGEITIVEVKGRIDSNTATAFGERLASLIKAGRARLVVDLRHIIYISSAGFRMLLVAGRLAEKANSTLALCSLSAEAQRLFDLGAFTDLFVIYGSRDEALAKLS